MISIIIFIILNDQIYNIINDNLLLFIYLINKKLYLIINYIK